MFRPWNPTKAEIERWLKTKELEFVQKDNKNPKLTPCKYLDKYMFSDLHEVFFCDFPHVLQEWLLRLKDNHPTNRIRQIEWNPVEITQLQQVNNKFTCASRFLARQYCCRVYHRICSRYRKVLQRNRERVSKGPRGRYIRSLYTSIKILLYNKGVMTMESDN
jgi:hypothetical protein